MQPVRYLRICGVRTEKQDCKQCLYENSVLQKSLPHFLNLLIWVAKHLQVHHQRWCLYTGYCNTLPTGKSMPAPMQSSNSPASLWLNNHSENAGLVVAADSLRSLTQRGGCKKFLHERRCPLGWPCLTHLASSTHPSTPGRSTADRAPRPYSGNTSNTTN